MAIKLPTMPHSSSRGRCRSSLQAMVLLEPSLPSVSVRYSPGLADRRSEADYVSPPADHLQPPSVINCQRRLILVWMINLLGRTTDLMGRKGACAWEFFCCMPVGARLTPEDRLRCVWSAGGLFPWLAFDSPRCDCGASFQELRPSSDLRLTCRLDGPLPEWKGMLTETTADEVLFGHDH